MNNTTKSYKQLNNMYYTDFFRKYCLAGASKNENNFQLESVDELVNKVRMKIVYLEM